MELPGTQRLGSMQMRSDFSSREGTIRKLWHDEPNPARPPMLGEPLLLYRAGKLDEAALADAAARDYAQLLHNLPAEILAAPIAA